MSRKPCWIARSLHGVAFAKTCLNVIAMCVSVYAGARVRLSLLVFPDRAVDRWKNQKGFTLFFFSLWMPRPDAYLFCDGREDLRPPVVKPSWVKLLILICFENEKKKKKKVRQALESRAERAGWHLKSCAGVEWTVSSLEWDLNEPFVPWDRFEWFPWGAEMNSYEFCVPSVHFYWAFQLSVWGKKTKTKTEKKNCLGFSLNHVAS